MRKQYLIKISYTDRSIGKTYVKTFYKNVKPEYIAVIFFDTVNWYHNQRDFYDVKAYCEEIIVTKRVEL